MVLKPFFFFIKVPWSVSGLLPYITTAQLMQFLYEIFGLLASLPRQMLLLLKMNDCLRHIDYQLGSPTNTVIGEYNCKQQDGA